MNWTQSHDRSSMLPATVPGCCKCGPDPWACPSQGGGMGFSFKGVSLPCRRAQPGVSSLMAQSDMPVVFPKGWSGLQTPGVSRMLLLPS